MGKPKKHQSSDAAADELNLETLKDEGELVSIATLKQMLDVQQSMLKTLFDSFISTVNARVDKLADSVASLKASLEFTQKDVGDLSSLKSKLVGAIKEKLIIEVDIERAHRVERRKSGGINQHQADAKPRVIVCRLSSWKQKEAVVRKARKEKPEGLFICEDLSQATLEKRKPHLEKLKAAKQAGKSAYFILDRLIIRDKPFGSSND